MLSVLAMVLAGQTTQNWFGPATVDFDLKTTGNPFDYELNDVKVEFTGPRGQVESRMGYFANGRWHATLVANAKGTYPYKVLLNGKSVLTAQSVSLSKPIPEGYVRTRGPWGFRFDNGKPFWPVGFNLAWQSPGLIPMTQAFEEFPKWGVNWSRIWTNHWDGKNPMWVKDDPLQFDEKPLEKWSQIVQSAEKGNVKFQWVLFHHGPWSSRVNSNWKENPWNKANGGFLEKPGDFFTSERAKKIVRAWLRYAIARYGHSPSIMSWELFNEVEWVDPNYENKQALIGKWHEEMTAWILAHDPYEHLVTSSSEMHLPIYKTADYYQPHGYPASVRNLLLNSDRKSYKPYFYGEIGPSGLMDGPATQKKAIREAILTSFVLKHSGAAQYWAWDNVYKQDLLPEFKFLTKILSDSGLMFSNMNSFTPVIDAPEANLEVQPSGGWMSFKEYDFELPKDASKLAGIPSFFQGMAHPEMRRKPVTLRFSTKRGGSLKITFSENSASGGSLSATIAGKPVASISFKSGDKIAGKELVVPIPPGDVELILENEGQDWLKIDRFSIPGIGSRVNTISAGTDSSCLLHVQKQPNTAGFASGIRNLPLKDGTYVLAIYDLNKYSQDTKKVTVRSGAMRTLINFDQSDSAIVIRR
jgi:hypothetical protein